MEIALGALGILVLGGARGSHRAAISQASAG